MQVWFHSDAGFEPWIAKLNAVTFHAKLGSQGERVQRIIKLAKDLCAVTRADEEAVGEAALLCKADLNSAMVYEFPEVQGKMGRTYAEEIGKPSSVALAIQEHYSPLGPSDDVPSNPVSVTVALADKLDLLTGFWAIDEKPTGSKDPYALRRAALGVIRLVIDNEIRLPLLQTANQDLLSFFHDRLKVYLRDQGIRHDLIDAVLTETSDDLLIITRKARALQALIDSEDGKNLLAGYKRAANILAAEEKKNTKIAAEISEDLFSLDAETALHAAIAEASSDAIKASEDEDFQSAMTALAKLRVPVDSFFDDVLVNDEDEAVRGNRLALLSSIREATAIVADFSKITG